MTQRLFPNLEEFKELTKDVDWKDEVRNWAINRIEDLDDWTGGEILDSINDVVINGQQEDFEYHIPDGFELPVSDADILQAIQEAIRSCMR